MKGHNKWINTHSGQASEAELKRIWELTSTYKDGYDPNVEEGHATFMKKVRGAQQRSYGGKVVPINRVRRYFFRIAASVAILVLSGIAVNHFMAPDLEQLTTRQGEVELIGLSDGSSVALNSGSQLDFPLEFTGSDRTVLLEGEAFFNVKRNEKRPFRVETENALIQVLGTSFNVRSFSGENQLEVFVNTGSVEVFLKKEGSSYTLKQDDLLQVDFSKNQALKKVDEDKNSMAWNKQLLNFQNRPLGEIFKTIESVYDVNFGLADSALENCPFTINLSLLTLEEGVKGIESACGIAIAKLDNNKYEVRGKCCE